MAAVRFQERPITNTRNIAIDAAFVVFYIGLSAGMACLTLTLAVLVALGTDFSATHATALAVNAVGWVVVAAAPQLYRMVLGSGFSWRQNTMLGDTF